VTGAGLGLFVSVFLASAVEAVEALTIVLAVGGSREWRSALLGAGGGGLALAVLVAALGPALGALPIDLLRFAVGVLLLVFGLQWLRKAILRASGLMPLRDEDAVFAREEELAHEAPPAAGLDPYSLTIAFKAVLLEGLEVALIVVGFGSSQGRTGLAVLAAVGAVAVVIAAGIAVRAPLSRVPENAMKFAVGVLLSAFGVFWTLEGAGVAWPGGEASAAVLVLLTATASVTATKLLARRWNPSPTSRR
jgi:uncharacterized membrane protein